MKKKHILLLCMAVLLCAILLLVCTGSEKVPVPEKIVLYRDGASQVLLPEEAAFSRVYSLIRMEADAVQETAIDPDVILEVKKDLAVEYIYDGVQQVGGRNCTHVLFSLSGWTENSAILYMDGEYRSGTYAFSVSTEKLIEVFE